MRSGLLLLPLLVVYLLIAASGAARPPIQDEPRYLHFADNLTHGAYSAPGTVQLWSAPGYPLLLAPFRAIGCGPGVLRLLNAPLLFIAVSCFYRFLGNHFPDRTALLGALALGLYFPVWKFLPWLMSEVLALALVCALLWAWSEIIRRERVSRGWLAMAGIAFAWLSLTRPVFGYALFACLAVYLIAAVLGKKPCEGSFSPSQGLAATPTLGQLRAGSHQPCEGLDEPSQGLASNPPHSALRSPHPALRNARRLLIAHLIAVVLCLPWLGYTYARTGKLFYWATSGGLSLYWMTSGGEGEWGDWQGPDEVALTPELAPHRGFFDKLRGMTEVQSDDALRAQAWKNLAARPSAFLRNIAANLSRLFFSFPYTHTPQKLSTLFYALPNSFLLAFTTLALLRLIRRARTGAIALYPYLIFAAAGFCATAVLSAYPRMLFPFVPVIILLIVSEVEILNVDHQDTKAPGTAAKT